MWHHVDVELNESLAVLLAKKIGMFACASHGYAK
jgi:hypothetical protein